MNHKYKTHSWMNRTDEDSESDIDEDELTEEEKEKRIRDKQRRQEQLEDFREVAIETAEAAYESHKEELEFLLKQSDE